MNTYTYHREIPIQPTYDIIIAGGGPSGAAAAIAAARAGKKTLLIEATGALGTRLQGILLTIAALALFIIAMILAPKLKLRPKTLTTQPAPHSQCLAALHRNAPRRRRRRVAGARSSALTRRLRRERLAGSQDDVRIALTTP